MPPDSSAGDRSPTLGRQPDLRQELGGARRVPRRGVSLRLGQQAEGHVLPDRQAVEQRAVLEQHADARPG